MTFTKILQRCGVVIFALMPMVARADEYEEYVPKEVIKDVAVPHWMVYGYSVLWIGLIALAIYVWQSQKKINRDLERLQKRATELNSLARS